MKIKYRVFVQDVGKSGFSGVRDVIASDPESAIAPFATEPGSGLWYGKKLIALPHSRKDLWPHPYKGTVPREALRYR